MRAIPVRATSKLGRIIYKAVLACGKGRVLVIDCKAIGGSGGWKRIAGVGRPRRYAQLENPSALPRRRERASLEGALRIAPWSDMGVIPEEAVKG